MRIVLDTNVIVSGIFWGRNPGQILNHWISGSYELLLSSAILEEYGRVLYRISNGRRDDLAARWLLFVSEHSHIIDVKKRFSLSRDPDDDKFIECSVCGRADFLVSGDPHLLDLHSVMNVRIVKPAQFLSILQKQTPSG